MIPCQYSVIEAVIVKFDIFNLSRYQLQRIIPPNHYSVVLTHNVVDTRQFLMEQYYQQVHQIWELCMTVIPEISNREPNIYFILMLILIIEAHATWHQV